MSEALTHGSLFAGMGGLDLAITEVFGATTAWVSDVDPGACRILAHRYPDAPNVGDITTIGWSRVDPVDIISGGSPCQDLSQAGRRSGMRPGTRSGLWESMRKAVATLRPRYVVWENVRGALSAEAASDLEYCPGCMGDPGAGGPTLRALGRVLGDLAGLGYDAQWYSLRAADVGACHARFRVFVLATAADHAGRGEHRWPVAGQSAQPWSASCSPIDGLKLLPTPTSNLGSNGGPQDPTKRRAGGHSVSIEDAVYGMRDGFGEYTEAVTRQERLLNGPAPSPVEPAPRGAPRLSPRFVEWMMCAPAGWVTGVPGLTRNQMLKALGNGVVPPQAATALRIMLDRMEAVA